MEKEIKKFKDLKFKEHPIGMCGKISSLNFKNGYGVSVVFGKMFYSNGKDTYELAITKGDNICYDSGIIADVIGHQSKEEITKLMAKVQKLK